jgi:hypothetical protein
MRRLLCFAVMLPLLTLLPARADALTVRDVIELTRAGLGDEILLALVEVDPSVFPIDTATLKRLKEAGVSERVIVAMVRSARTPAPPPEPMPVAADEPASAPEPQVVVIDHHDTQVREVPVAVPVYIPVAVRSTHHESNRTAESDRAAHESGRKDSPRATEPVFWGFGGKLRPDAWQPSPDAARSKKRN